MPGPSRAPSTSSTAALFRQREAPQRYAGEKSEPRGSPQLALVDLAVRTKLLVDSVDAYVLTMPSPVNRQKRCLHPVVKERQTLVNQLQSLLRDLGLERRVSDATDVAAVLASLQGPARVLGSLKNHRQN